MIVNADRARWETERVGRKCDILTDRQSGRLIAGRQTACRETD